MSTTTHTVTDRRTTTAIKPPSRYSVIFHNDDQTPMDFVTALLLRLYHHDEVTATAITEEVHLQGKGVAGIYSHEVADQKMIETIKFARSNGFPLAVTLEST